MQKVDFFGTLVSEINEESQLKRIKETIDSNKPGFVTYTNVHVVVTAKNNNDLQKAINSADIVSPDGAPIVWIAKMRGYKNITKCSGPDMMEKILRMSCIHEYTNYFYGSTNETLNLLKDKLKANYPNLKIAGMYSPPFKELSEEEIHLEFEKINRINPDIIWVGLGAPKQELWMAKAVEELGRGVMLGVGAAFDFFAGSKKRAPYWMQKAGLEWLYRLASEPRRLWKRYFVTNTLFIYYLFKSIRNKNVQG